LLKNTIYQHGERTKKNMRKIFSLLCCLLLLGAQGMAWAADSVSDVRTIEKTEKKVVVEYPFIIKGSKSINEKINSEIGKTVDSLVGEANTLGGGKVHYDMHRVAPELISMSIIMTPKQGVEETVGLTFDRNTGDKRPVSYYYGKEELLRRAADGLKYLYNVAPAKANVAPDTYYVDEDSNVIGIYHAGAVLDKSEGEIEVDLSAATTATPVAASLPVVDTAPVIDSAPVTDSAPVADTTPAADTTPVIDSTAADSTVAEGTIGQGTITGTEVRMRNGAGTASAILGYFTKGEVVQVLKSDMVNGAKWYNVRRTDGTTGWVSADYCGLNGESVSEVETPVEKTGKIVGTEVRMRSEPSLDADVLAYFNKGETVTILDTATGSALNWTKVKRSGGTIGWVSSAYCQEQ
jgi:SH3-like domain-containing protein